jgi:hypothetical protein
MPAGLHQDPRGRGLKVTGARAAPGPLGRGGAIVPSRVPRPSRRAVPPSPPATAHVGATLTHPRHRPPTRHVPRATATGAPTRDRDPAVEFRWRGRPDYLARHTPVHGHSPSHLPSAPPAAAHLPPHGQALRRTSMTVPSPAAPAVTSHARRLADRHFLAGRLPARQLPPAPHHRDTVMPARPRPPPFPTPRRRRHGRHQGAVRRPPRAAGNWWMLGLGGDAAVTLMVARGHGERALASVRCARRPRD